MLPSPAPLHDHHGIKVAALLHDVDDAQYFPHTSGVHENALELIRLVEVPAKSHASITDMIALVSCSKDGNRVPASIAESIECHPLIPWWADRLEAVGSAGAVRCYLYSLEQGRPLSSPFAASADHRAGLGGPPQTSSRRTRPGAGIATT
jgi:hypothetical protein